MKKSKLILVLACAGLIIVLDLIVLDYENLSWSNNYWRYISISFWILLGVLITVRYKRLNKADDYKKDEDRFIE